MMRRRVEVHDIVTPTPAERVRADQKVRIRRYLTLMGVCLVLVLFAFTVPAPMPLRIVAAIVAALIPPFASIVGNRSPGQG